MNKQGIWFSRRDFFWRSAAAFGAIAAAPAFARSIYAPKSYKLSPWQLKTVSIKSSKGHRAEVHEVSLLETNIAV